MPTYNKANNDVERAAFLRRAANTGTADIAAGTPYLGQATVDEVTALAATYETALSALSTNQSGRSREIRQRQEAIETLATYVRDFWEVARRRARRLGQPAEVLTFYGLPLDGMSPNPSTADEWLTWAGTVVQGDAEAVTAGYAAMSNPSAVEITAVLTTAQQEVTEANAADRTYDQSQEQLAEVRAQADQLIDDVMAELRFTLRRKDAASQRRVMRTYGAVFTYLDGEPRDPDDQPEEPVA
ncbi:MAG: hypothetical protein KDD89_01725 [Anaerolineales bacterium]|nr:hypothetical protein [Anaerolineales bacterium]